MKKIIILLSLFFSLNLLAQECFKASGKVFKDAQLIRKTALNLGWKVYKPVSVGASLIAKAKVKIYPENDVNVCLRKDNSGRLEIKIQSDAPDANQANWNILIGKPIKSNKDKE